MREETRYDCPNLVPRRTRGSTLLRRTVVLKGDGICPRREIVNRREVRVSQHDSNIPVFGGISRGLAEKPIVGEDAGLLLFFIVLEPL